jgi:hypothetical protein
VKETEWKVFKQQDIGKVSTHAKKYRPQPMPAVKTLGMTPRYKPAIPSPLKMWLSVLKTPALLALPGVMLLVEQAFANVRTFPPGEHGVDFPSSTGQTELNIQNGTGLECYKHSIRKYSIGYLPAKRVLTRSRGCRMSVDATPPEMPANSLSNC